MTSSLGVFIKFNVVDVILPIRLKKSQYFDFQREKITQKDFKNVNSSNLIAFFKRKNGMQGRE